MKRFLVLYLMVFSFYVDAHVLIITHSFNRPDFIKIQHATFKKFFTDDYEFVVFNDANNTQMKHKIMYECRQVGVKCFNIPQEIHGTRQLSSERTSDAIQYSLNTLGFDHNGIVIVIDSDMVLIKPFSVESFLKDYAIAGVPQSRGHARYLWNGLVFMDMRILPDKRTLNFDCGRVDGEPVDSGGQLHHYLKAHPLIQPLFLGCNHTSSLVCSDCEKRDNVACAHNTEFLINAGLNARCIKLMREGIHNIEFLVNGSFLHYRGGANWDHKSQQYHAHKTHLFNELIRDILR